MTNRTSLGSRGKSTMPQKSNTSSLSKQTDQTSGKSADLRILNSGDNDESAVWLSHIIRQVWPYAANIAQCVLLEYVQPALNANVPKGIPAPRFTKIDIGDDPPVIERVRVDHRKYPGNDIAAVIEADITYDGTPDIQMTLSDVTTFGVSHAKLKGRVEILLRPLLDRIPLIGAAQIAFINRPDLDYTLTGLAAVANQSFIRGLVRSAVDEVLAHVAVLPNRVAYKCAPDTDYFLFAAQPVGVLRVAALCGKGFPSTDRNPLKQAVGLSELPDVYLKFTHGSTTMKTKPVYDRADPVWQNELFDFVLTSESATQRLDIEAYDYDLGTNDDYLGCASVLVCDLIRDGVKEIELTGAPEDAHPTVKLAAKWLTTSSDLRHVGHAITTHRSDTLRPKNCSSVLLTIDVDEARNLPPDKRPYVRVCVGPHVFNTNPGYNIEGVFSVEKPQFEQSFHVLLQGEVDSKLKVEFHVLDLYNGDSLGYGYAYLYETVEKGSDGATYNFVLLRAKQPNVPSATLRVRIRLAAVLDQPPLWKVLADPSSHDRM